MALTKVAGDILDPGLSIAGVVTATAFDGPFRGGSSSDIIAGIGTFTELDVNGNVDISGNLVVHGDQTTLNTTLRNVELLRVTANSSTTAGIITQTGSGDILNLFDGTTEVLTVTDGGRVGIGTDNPTDVLDVYSNTDPTIRSRSGSSSVGANIEICGGSSNDSQLILSSGTTNKYQFFRDGSQSDDLRIYDSANSLDIIRYRHGGYLHFGVNGEERLRITSSGKVGINTTTPQTELEVFSDTFSNITIHSARTSGNIGGFDFSNGASAAGIQTAQYFVHTSGHHYWHCNGSERLKLENDGDLTITGVDNAELKLKCGASTGNNILAFLNSAGATKGRIFYDSDNSFMVFNTDGTATERMRITNVGSVGITTSDPHGRLHISDATGTDAIVVERAGAAGGDSKWGIKPYAKGLYFRSNSDNSNSFNSRDRFALLWDGADARGSDVAFFGTAAGIASCTWDASDNALEFKDDSKTIFGDSQDLQIYHAAGADSIIHHTATSGSTLRLRSRGFTFKNQANNETVATLNEGDACTLFFSNTARIATTNKGVTVTGEVAASQDYPNFRPTIDFNFAAVKKLDPRFTYMRTGPGSYIDHLGFVRLSGYNEPRFDHDPDTGECLGLLFEQNATNLIPNSFDNGTWSAGTAGTLTRNAGIAPDGTNTATKASTTSNDIDVSPQLGNASAGATGQIAISGSTTYTLSIWAKASTTAQVGNNFKVRWKRVQGDGAFAETTFALTENWRRYSATNTTAANNSTVACYTGGVSGSEALVWGAQLEATDGGGETSLIPTYGESRTRGNETLSIEGKEFSDFYNQAEGTLILSAIYNENARSSAIVTIDDTSNTSEYTELGYRAGGASANNVAAYIRTDSGNDQYYKNWTSSATEGNEFKIGLAYKNNDYASSANGSAAHTDSSGTTSRLYDRLRFSEVDTVSRAGSGHYRRLMYYSKRLPNSQLTTLTA